MLTESNFDIVKDLLGTRIALITHEVSTVKTSKAYFMKCSKDRVALNEYYKEFDSKHLFMYMNKHLFKYMKKHCAKQILYFNIELQDVVLANRLIVLLYEYAMFNTFVDEETTFSEYISKHAKI